MATGILDGLTSYALIVTDGVASGGPGDESRQCCDLTFATNANAQSISLGDMWVAIVTVVRFRGE